MSTKQNSTNTPKYLLTIRDKLFQETCPSRNGHLPKTLEHKCSPCGKMDVIWGYKFITTFVMINNESSKMILRAAPYMAK